MGWGNIYKRRVKVFSLAFVVYLDYKALQQREKWMSKVKQDSLWEQAHERNAKRVLRLIIELEGLWVKLGQYMSTRADVLPQAYIFFLRQLQDSLPPRALEEVCHTIETELGGKMEALFSKFVDIPLATASIAQVHRATLCDGKEVVVKVQHDGIKKIILEDLKNAKSIVDWIAWAEPQYNFTSMIDEWCKEAPKELDFNHEAENTRTVSKNLGCRNRSSDNAFADSVDVLIPEVIQSTEKLLVLEYMDGVRLNDSESLDALGVDKQKLIEEITRSYAHQIYVDGFFNGDPHPGNFLVSKDPPHRPILLDFGLTKLISSPMKQALAKMLLAAGEGDHVALLSAFAEMGLKLRLDMPEQAMEVTGMFFRTSAPASEARENVKALTERGKENMKVLQEKFKLDQKQVKRFTPIDAFPGDIVIFSRVLNLLRGLSSSMNTRIAYLEIMRPFAESILQNNIAKGPAFNPNWICDTPVHSEVEGKLRQLLIELGNINKILGIQVCAYKDGEVIIDTSAGVLGRYDPRPVQPDSLFPSFSTTKGVTAGMVHWLVDNGRLKLDENVANIWPEFRSNGKDIIKVHHVLNHTSGLHNALASSTQTDPELMLNWNECLRHIASSAPETEPGREQLYHYLSFGWLCGGIIEHATGKKFQDILEEAFIRPLNIEGEMYIGIPPGVESRLATLTVDTDDLKMVSGMTARSDLPSTFQPQAIAALASALQVQFNTLNVRRAIIPAANGHFSARALARYYATLVDGGKVPPPHSLSSKPPLGSHTHLPKFPSLISVKKPRNGKKKESVPKFKNNGKEYISVPIDDIVASSSREGNEASKIFNNPNIHDLFLGRGEYENLILASGKYGLGFKKWYDKDGSLVGFGHSGMGGSTGYCDIDNRFSISVTLNKMSFGSVTGKIVQFVCSELGISVPDEFSSLQPGVARPMIN